jgi:hypothetical protein
MPNSMSATKKQQQETSTSASVQNGRHGPAPDRYADYCGGIEKPFVDTVISDTRKHTVGRMFANRNDAFR